MPYRRRYRRRRVRRSRKSSGRGYASMAYKAYRTAKYLYGLINVEFKHKDIIVPNQPITDTPIILPLTLMPEGTDEGQRNGRSVLLKSNYLHGQLILTGTATSAFTRIIIFRDKVSNGVLPIATDLLETTSIISSPLNTDNARNRFQVLFDGRYQQDDNKNPQQVVKVYRKQRHHLVYKGPTGTIADVSTGHLYLLLWTSIRPVGGTISFEYTNRVMFVDN